MAPFPKKRGTRSGSDPWSKGRPRTKQIEAEKAERVFPANPNTPPKRGK